MEHEVVAKIFIPKPAYVTDGWARIEIAAPAWQSSKLAAADNYSSSTDEPPQKAGIVTSHNRLFDIDPGVRANRGRNTRPLCRNNWGRVTILSDLYSQSGSGSANVTRIVPICGPTSLAACVLDS